MVDWFLQAEEEIDIFKPFYAPERFLIEDSEVIDFFKADAWSVGILLYFVLTGRNAFTSQKLKMQEEIKNVDLSVNFRIADKVSAEAKDLVKSLLNVNP